MDQTECCGDRSEAKEEHNAEQISVCRNCGHSRSIAGDNLKHGAEGIYVPPVKILKSNPKAVSFGQVKLPTQVCSSFIERKRS